MNNDFWDDTASELDMLEDVEEVEELAQQLAEQPDLVEASEEEIEELVEESAYDLNEHQASTIFNARIRLEQAKLYEMLINHNLFEGVEASPQAIERVQNELKYYIVSRLEVLMGMRQPVQRKEGPELPLNHVELDFLKALAYKGTKGASIKAEREEEDTEPGPRPVQPKLRPQGLKPLVKQKTAPKKTKQVSKKKSPKQPPQQEKPLQTQPKSKPKKNNTVRNKIKSDGVLSKRNLTEAEIIALAKEDIENSTGKPLHEMTAKERAERVKQVNAKYQPKPRPENAAPMPTADQLAATYMTQQTMRSGSQNQMTQFKEILANALVQGNVSTKESE